MKSEKSWPNKTAWKLYKENWELCKQIVDLRDGHRCQIPGCTAGRLALDHVFSRSCKRLFFITNNLGWLCLEHHTHKSFRHGQWVDKMVDQLCRNRNGDGWWDFASLESKLTLGKFRTVAYQEQTNIRLKEELCEMLSNK